MTGTEQETTPGLDRRGLIRRAAAVGAASVWATPTIQSLTAPAFATGSPAGGCVACLAGTGAIIGSPARPITCYGAQVSKISFVLRPICCAGDGVVHLQIRVHRQPKQKDLWFNFTERLQLTCATTGPTRAPDGNRCANRFTGTIESLGGNTLTFSLTDNGTDGLIDDISLSATRDGASVFTAAGSTAAGNLRNPDGWYAAELTRDCRGC